MLYSFLYKNYFVNKLNCYLQQTEWTCGAASMKIMLEACGIVRTEKQIVKMLKTNIVRGTWSKYFPQVAEKFCLNYVVYRNGKVRDLIDTVNAGYFVLTAYYISKQKIDHYSVVKNIDDQYIYFLDPMKGPNHKYKLSYFARVWKTDPKYDNEKGWFIGVKN